MNNEIQPSSKTQAIRGERAMYAAPRLIRYGEVRSLTQSGSKTGQEGVLSMSTSCDPADNKTMGSCV